MQESNELHEHGRTRAHRAGGVTQLVLRTSTGIFDHKSRFWNDEIDIFGCTDYIAQSLDKLDYIHFHFTRFLMGYCSVRGWMGIGVLPVLNAK